MIRKSSAEDSSSKWEDNKNKSSKIGLESVMLKDNLEDQTSHSTTETNLKGNQELKNPKPKVKSHPNKPNQKLKKKSNIKSNHKSNIRSNIKLNIKSSHK